MYNYPNSYYPQHYPQYPQQPNQQYNDLLNRLNNLEQGYGYGQTQQPHTPPTQATNPVNQSPIANNPNDNKLYAIVSAESQAWEKDVDLSGNVQVFYNPTEDCFYTQQFIASIPKTVRKTFKAISTPSESISESEVSEVMQDNKNATETILDSLGDIKESVDTLSENIQQSFGKIDDLILQIAETPYVYVKDIVKQKESKKGGTKK